MSAPIRPSSDTISVTRARAVIPRRFKRARLLATMLTLAALPTSLHAQSAPAAPAAATVLTLGGAARLAAERSGAVEIANTRVELANARVVQSRSELLPDLTTSIRQGKATINSVTFGFSLPGPDGTPLIRPDGELIGPVRTIDFRYRLAQPIVNVASFARYRAAQSGISAASAEKIATADAAASTAASVYVRAVRAQAQVAARVADSTLAAELLGIARDQLAAGSGIALDVTRAQSQLASTRASLIAARNERDRALLELKRAIGIPLTQPVALADSLSGLPVDAANPDATASLDRALNSRADIRALVALEDAQKLSVKAVRYERLPSLNFVVDHGVLGRNLDRLLPTYTFGLQLSVGVFDGFRRTGRLEETEATIRETDARLRELREQSSLEAQSALLDLSAAREQVAATEERVRLAEQEVSQAQDRFRAGVSGNADVITALLSLNGARTQRIDALAAYQNARVALARATGSVRDLR